MELKRRSLKKIQLKEQSCIPDYCFAHMGRRGISEYMVIKAITDKTNHSYIPSNVVDISITVVLMPIQDFVIYGGTLSSAIEPFYNADIIFF